MDFLAVIAALNSPTRLSILRVLSRQALTANEVFKALKKNGETQLSCRESAYKALERLVEAGLVEKFYDSETKSIRYRITYHELVLDLVDNRIRAPI